VIRVLFALLLLTATVGAEAPGTHPPSSPPAPAAASDADAPKPLRRLATGASAIVVADVLRAESYDEDRLRVHRVRVTRVLRGRLDEPEPGVVEMGPASPRLPLLTAGQRVVVLLDVAPRYTYLTQHLPSGDYYEAVAGRAGVIPVGGDAEIDTVEKVLAEGAESAGLERVAAAAARRRLAFVELASGNPRLAADALVELGQLGTFASLSADEVATLKRTFGDRRIEPSTRAGLMTLLGERKVGGTLDALAGAETETPALLEAFMDARAALGAPPRAADLSSQLSSSDPATRAAALHALAHSEDPQTLDQLTHYATLDQSTDVRVAAVEAMGERKRPDAVPVLTRTFTGSDAQILHASARAFMAIGGPDVERAVGDLALHAPTPEARRYAALVLILNSGRDSQAARRIAAASTDPGVRDLIEKGVPELER